jgi:hypothetical protein
MPPPVCLGPICDASGKSRRQAGAVLIYSLLRVFLLQARKGFGTELQWPRLRNFVDSTAGTVRGFTGSGRLSPSVETIAQSSQGYCAGVETGSVASSLRPRRPD